MVETIEEGKKTKKNKKAKIESVAVPKLVEVIKEKKQKKEKAVIERHTETKTEVAMATVSVAAPSVVASAKTPAQNALPSELDAKALPLTKRALQSLAAIRKQEAALQLKPVFCFYSNLRARPVTFLVRQVDNEKQKRTKKPPKDASLKAAEALFKADVSPEQKEAKF